jgi:hypothetical protein
LLPKIEVFTEKQLIVLEGRAASSMTQSNPVSIEIRPITDLHAIPIPDIYKRLETRPDGLAEAEVKEHQNRFGLNRILKVKGEPLVLKLLANFTHLMALAAMSAYFFLNWQQG